MIAVYDLLSIFAMLSEHERDTVSGCPYTGAYLGTANIIRLQCFSD